MRIWFHGTSQENADKILKSGFKIGTHFAAALEDAIEFGGHYVFEVGAEFESGYWQVQTVSPIAADKIISLRHYEISTLESHPDRRKALLKRNS